MRVLRLCKVISVFALPGGKLAPGDAIAGSLRYKGAVGCISGCGLRNTMSSM